MPFLMFIGLAASQLASVPHAHLGISAEMQQEHDATPHFHGDWLGVDHHGHGHSHPGHGHDHNRPSEPAKKLPVPDGFNVHDATAIYCFGTASSDLSEGLRRDSHRLLSFNHGPVVGWHLLATRELNGGKVAQRRPPDKSPNGVKTYLTLGNLRL